jgi:hypothetical protein
MSLSSYPASFGLILFALGVSTAGESNAIAPTVLLQKLQGDHAQSVVQRLNDAQWSFILKHIESGEKTWLDVAESLHERTDAGQSEMLSLAVGIALLENPSGALGTTVAGLPIEGVCGYPDMTDARTDSQAKVVAYLDARIQTLAKVTTKKGTEQRNKCVQILEATRTDVLSPNGPFSRRS